MTDRKTVLVHIHVSQGGEVATKAGSGSVKAVVSSPGATRATVSTGGAHSARGERGWAVAFRGQKYDVLDAGAKGMTISHDGAVVWTGHRLPTGGYHTHTSTIPASKLEGLLRLVGVGDSRTPKVHVAESRPAGAASQRARESAGPAATESKRPISEAQAEALAQGREVRAERLASQRAGTAPRARAKPKAKRSVKPAASAPRAAASARKSAPKPKGAASAARPTGATAEAAAAKRGPGRPRKHAAAATAAAPTAKKTERAPATRRSVRNPAVDDTAVLAEIKKKLRREDPHNAAAVYDLLRRVWFAGGREATLAWMAARNISTVVEAFRDWVDKNPEAARNLIENSPQGGQSAAA